MFRNLGTADNIESKWKVSSGLVRQDYYDWPSQIRPLVKTKDYKYVVVLFGANDNKNFRINRKLVRWGQPKWPDHYKDRVEQILELVCTDQTHLFWLEVPPMRQTALDESMVIINQVFEKTLASSPCGEFVRTKNLLGSSNGYSSYVRAGGQSIKTRSGDGIHITPAGGRLIGEKIMALITDRAGGSGEQLSH